MTVALDSLITIGLGYGGGTSRGLGRPGESVIENKRVIQYPHSRDHSPARVKSSSESPGSLCVPRWAYRSPRRATSRPCAVACPANREGWEDGPYFKTGSIEAGSDDGRIRPSGPARRARTRGQPLGYAFDPIPSAIRGDRRLKPVDHLVLAILISFAVWRRDSCWAAVASIAARLPALQPGRSGATGALGRTVQRSINRLKAAGYIRHERVARPDPDDPRNRTGWRFFFNFVPIQGTGRGDAGGPPGRAGVAPGAMAGGDREPGRPAPPPGAGRVTPLSGRLRCHPSQRRS